MGDSIYSCTYDVIIGFLPKDIKPVRFLKPDRFNNYLPGLIIPAADLVLWEKPFNFKAEIKVYEKENRFGHRGLYR
jgi:hypothetical protein